MASHTKPSTANAVLPPGLPDGWVYDGDAECPTCRYNLRMQRVPRCPECGTLHRWQTLLGICCPRCGQPLCDCDGTSCPACGLELDWVRLLETADPRGARSMEYSTRPIRSALLDWRLAHFPSVFWSRLRLESRPNMVRLRRFRHAAVALFCAGVVAALLCDPVWTIVSPGIRRAWWGGGRASLDWDLAWIVVCLICVPHVLSRAALPRFTPTLARFRISGAQFVRVFSYSTVGLASVGVLFLAGTVSVLGARSLGFYARFGATGWSDWVVGVRGRRGWFAGIGPLEFLVAMLFCVLAFVWPVRFDYVALRHYLRLDRRSALGISLGAQAIALLTGVILFLWLTAARTVLRWR